MDRTDYLYIFAAFYIVVSSLILIVAIRRDIKNKYGPHELTVGDATEAFLASFCPFINLFFAWALLNEAFRELSSYVLWKRKEESE